MAEIHRALVFSSFRSVVEKVKTQLEIIKLAIDVLMTSKRLRIGRNDTLLLLPSDNTIVVSSLVCSFLVPTLRSESKWAVLQFGM